MLEKIIFRKEKSRNPCVSTVSGLEWQGQKDTPVSQAASSAAVALLVEATIDIVACFLYKNTANNTV